MKLGNIIKKNIFTFIFTFFLFNLHASNEYIYEATLVNEGQSFGFIDIPYSAGDTQLVISPSDILAQIEKKHENSCMLKPKISLDSKNDFYPEDPSFSMPMPREEKPLKFLLKFPMDSGFYHRENFLTVDDNNNQLKEGDIMCFTKKYQVFKDSFCGKLFIKLRTPDANEDLGKQIESGDYKIISSNPEEINTGRIINFTLSSCMHYVVVLLMLCATNFYSYQINTVNIF
jgi:hypothetical protein